MSDEEFDLIDELYFVQPYSHLVETLGWENDLILRTLESLQDKGWIKCLRSPDEEIFSKIDFQQEATNLFFLATKEGLMKHNMG